MKAIKKIKSFLSSYPRFRMILIFILVITVFVLVINNLTETKAEAQDQGSYAVEPSMQMRDKATNYTNKVYNEIKNIHEKNKIRQAANQGKTIAEQSTQEITPVVDEDSGSPRLSAQDQRVAKLTNSKVYKEIVKRDALQKNYSELKKGQGKNQDQQKYLMQVSQKERKMQSQLQGMVGDWDKASVQSSVVGQLPAQSTTVGQQGQSTAANIIEKSGAILFAVLDTQLNSDQPGTPVMATIVQGKFKDAKLLGSFKREDDKLVISFDHMSLSALDHSISIKAYAINATTAQNALASDVDNHYLLRYGGLFASAFLQGFGEYFSDTSNSLCNGSTTCIVTSDQTSAATEKTSKKAVYSGLGQVGTTLGQQAASEFNRPPTVTLNQGVGMGILFMSDVKA
ncbi:intracellular multiplication protein IcmE [Piscirickettsia salmonis]|uniref:Type IV secretion system protein IcmE n=2 Tax=Piscirickettsia salmonis TaxID=1238 RepID=A0A1L6TEF1_PISSA|nr:TrbI/VirB10 family protein [Piscirickettsia salmonis]AKP72730.1 conjugal transfer protein TrbI [Piscirickettsia salmonis LF-89 = ATCC VR-1361]ALB23766.1 type IV secretion system protein IcmE [Piscirickettsia salmonis]ALY03613.1 conjugal transfer protein TrbI [Piscirickettsia salmonis]AMA43177.1 conjugal transfer protein TrbI [Piscirickettsia salmonis]AOS35649.1 conjugal transfer protein TrbI [Piscirickettsia salmonis]